MKRKRITYTSLCGSLPPSTGALEANKAWRLGRDISKAGDRENKACMFQTSAHNHQQISLAVSSFSVGVCSIQLIPSS